jgi:subtilisin family serine protease
MFRFVTKNRSFGFRVALVLGVVFATVLGATPAQAYIAVARTTYIVQVKTGTSLHVRDAIGKLGETPHDELTEVMDGFVLDLTDAEAAALRADANVIQVVADQTVSVLDTQNPTPSWGLDRIDQTNTTYDSTYTYPASAGAGVKVYIVDTGVMASDPDFTGRVETGVDILGQNLQGADCNGHGTHVAGTIAGTKYGVAKKATIVPIRVLGCSGSGSMSSIVSAIDWIIANNPAGTPAVMSASIGGGKYQLVNDAIEKLYQAGITPVIAAGNNNADAAGYSPASAPNAITVGASDSTDSRASFSNFGDLVDVFAPGVNIISDNYLDPTTGRSLSGTSMATPHVSGLVALYLADHKTATPAEVTAAIKAGAQAGIIVDAKSANGNYLINNKFTNAALPPVGAPTNVAVSAITATSATVTWSAPTGTQAAASYKVEYKDSTATTWTSVDSATTTVALTNLVSNSTYSVRVSSVAGSTISPASPESIFSTLADVPAVVTNLRSTASFGTQVSIAWDAPVNSNGSKITGYEVWMNVAGTWTKKYNVGVTTATISSLQPSTSYSVRVVAVNAIGSSVASPELTITTTSATPGAVSLTGVSSTTATGTTVGWRAVAPIDSATPISYTVLVTDSTTGATVATYTTSALSQVITGLTRYTYYRIAVTAFSGSVAGPTSSQYTFRTLADVPTAVTNLSVSKLNATQFTISWNSPRDGGGVAITQYKVEQFVAGVWTLVATNDVTVASLVVSSPAAGAQEQYRVSAVNSIGTGPATITTVTGTITAPQPATALVATPVSGASYFVLSWTAPTNTGGSPITTYTVVRSIDGGTTWSNVALGITGTNYNVSLPPRGATYQYSVLALNVVGTSVRAVAVSYSVAAVAPAAPAAPTLTWNSSGDLNIAWVAPSDNGGSAITGYKVQRLVAGAYATVATVAAGTLSTTLPREAVFTAYSIRVISVNAIGDSAASAVSQISVPGARPSAPLNLVADSSGIGRVNLTWQAPANAAGSIITGYTVQYSTNAGAAWNNLASTNLLTISFAAPPKGSNYQYRVYALSAVGNGDFSNVVSVSIAATPASAPGIRSIAFASDGSLVFSWNAPSDNGGSAITGYRVEYSTDGTTFTAVATVAANVSSLSLRRDNPGVRSYVRVVAITGVGAGAYSSVVSILTPYVKASAPQNFTAVDNGSAVVVAWAAPANLGGSPSVTYSVQASKDGGSSFIALAASNLTTINVSRPTKGSTWQYRVVANTSFGLSDYSPSVSISVAATAPSAPSNLVVALNSATSSLDIRWFAPSDNGGSAITSFVVQRSADNNNYSTVATVTGTVTSVSLAKDAPGVRSYWKIAAVNALGASPFSGVYSIQMPYIQASAVQQFAAVDTGAAVAVSWAAPADLGGSPSIYYYVQYSTNGGATWLNYVSTTALAYNVPRPAKGTSALYRAVAVTAFGVGQAVAPVNITAAATAPGAPSIRSFGLNSDLTSTLTFVAPTDNGGSALTSYLVEQSTNGTTWTTLTTVSTAAIVIVARQAPGVRLYVRVKALNAVGASLPSSSFSVQMPYVQASAVQNLVASSPAGATYVSLTWTAPADLGGVSAVSSYQIQSSADGTNWLGLTSTSTTAINISRPAKGQTLSYRVFAVTSWGIGLPSNTASATTATTVTSSVRNVTAVRQSDGSFVFSFAAPADLGGVATWSYKVQLLQGSNYNTVVTGAGAANNSVTVAAPAPNAYAYYRIIATNSNGDSASYAFSIRG